MMKWQKCALICAILSGCASVQPGATVALPDAPKPAAPAAAMQPVPPAGHFLQSWTALFAR